MSSASAWFSDHIAQWWDSFVHFTTNGTDSSELALVLVSLFMVMMTSFALALIMLWRRPLTILDKCLFVRETLFGALLTMTFYAFYTHKTISLYVRLGIYSLLFVCCLLLVISLVRENTMSSAEVEDERREKLERNKHHAY
jgi:hypothetical protein